MTNGTTGAGSAAVRWTAAGGLLLALAGCGTASKAQVAAFGHAAGLLADNAKRAFELVDRSAVDEKIYDVALDATLAPKDETFRGLLAAPGGDSAKSGALKVRLQLLEQLGAYARALEALAGADPQKELDQAATDLYSAMSGLRTSYEAATQSKLGLTDESLGTFATAVSGIGGFNAEQRRQHAMKTVILAADPSIQKAAALVQRDLGKGSELARNAKESLDNAEGSLRQAYNQEKALPTASFAARLAMLERIRALHATAAAVPGFFEDVSAGVESLAAAHKALAGAVSKDALTPEVAAQEIGELVARARAARAFRDSLAPKREGEGT